MVNRFNFRLFNRLITRSAELAAEPRMSKSLAYIYADTLAVPGDVFVKAHAEVTAYEKAWIMDSRATRVLLKQFDGLYRMARSALMVYEPKRTLPETLKAQRTDTDKLLAIGELYSALEAHKGKVWADDFLQGEFGALAPKVKVALEKSIATAKDLAWARDERMTAYTEAYDRFIAFKRFVRDALGSRSKQYRRIHPRSRGVNDIEPEDNTPADVAPPSQQAA